MTEEQLDNLLKWTCEAWGSDNFTESIKYANLADDSTLAYAWYYKVLSALGLCVPFKTNRINEVTNFMRNAMKLIDDKSDLFYRCGSFSFDYALALLNYLIKLEGAEFTANRNGKSHPQIFSDYYLIMKDVINGYELCYKGVITTDYDYELKTSIRNYWIVALSRVCYIKQFYGGTVIMKFFGLTAHEKEPCIKRSDELVALVGDELKNSQIFQSEALPIIRIGVFEYQQKDEAERKLQCGNAKSTGGCYITAAIYGNHDAPEVIVLRKYRDKFLKKSLFGRTFIKAYTYVAPNSKLVKKC